MARLCYLAAVLLASTFQIGSAHYHRNFILSGPGVQESQHADTLNDCINACDEKCSAVSYNDKYGYCVLTTCGNMNLKKATDWVTVVLTDAVTASQTIPQAAHEWGMTDRCGVESVGSYRAPTLLIGGTDYQLQNSALFGNALHFPNNRSVTAKTLPHASIGDYLPLDTSFSVAFFVNFKAVPAHACFFEFRDNNDDWGWHFWLWPNAQAPYVNLANSAGLNQGLNFEKNFQIVANNWYHFVFSYEASTAQISLFVDGKLVGSKFVSQYLKRSTNRIAIGGRPKDNIGFFDGSMYCMSVFKESLSLTQVAELRRSCVDGRVRFI